MAEERSPSKSSDNQHGPKSSRALPQECPVCHDEIHEKAFLSCGHSFCMECIVRWSNTNPICPYCKEKFNEIRQHACPSPSGHSPRHCHNITKHPVTNQRNNLADEEDNNIEDPYSHLAGTGEYNTGHDLLHYNIEDIHRLLILESPDKECHEIVRVIGEFYPSPNYLKQLDLFRMVYYECARDLEQPIDLLSMNNTRERIESGEYQYSETSAMIAERIYIITINFVVTESRRVGPRRVHGHTEVERLFNSDLLDYRNANLEVKMMIESYDGFETGHCSCFPLLSQTIQHARSNVKCSALEILRMSGIYFADRDTLSTLNLYRLTIFSNMDNTQPEYDEDMHFALAYYFSQKHRDIYDSTIYNPYKFVPQPGKSWQVLSQHNRFSKVENDRIRVEQYFMDCDGVVRKYKIDEKDAFNFLKNPDVSAQSIISMSSEQPSLSAWEERLNELEAYMLAVKKTNLRRIPQQTP